MSALPLTKPENISNLLHMDEEYAAPAIVADNVLQKDWNAERERSFKDPEGFWADYGDGKWGYVIDNWWQTELGGPALGTAPSMAMRPGKVGVAVPGAEADILDEDGTPVPPGVGGRLVLKRPFPCMLRTVWRDPARYERDWQFFPGYYVTGDVP